MGRVSGSAVFAFQFFPKRVMEFTRVRHVRKNSGTGFTPAVGVMVGSGEERKEHGVILATADFHSEESLAKLRAALHQRLDEVFDGYLNHIAEEQKG